MDKKRKGDSEKNEGGGSRARLQHEALFTETCIPECLQSASRHAENTRKKQPYPGGICRRGQARSYRAFNALPRISDSNL